MKSQKGKHNTMRIIENHYKQIVLFDHLSDSIITIQKQLFTSAKVLNKKRNKIALKYNYLLIS